MNDKRNPFDEETAKEMFTRIYKENIKRAGSEELFAWLEKTDFFVAPASTKYHGAYDGGLVAHSINVCNRLFELVALYINEDEEEYSRETIAICGLLHDVCKAQFYKKSFRNVKDEDTGKWSKEPCFIVDEIFPCGHSEKSIILIQSMMKLTKTEILSLRAHMGAFDNDAKAGGYVISNCFEACKLAPLLHTADLIATYINESR